ncbi:MAG: NAD-dependent epimerase/dehydratase family protein [Candidatus Marinimicrobia bacterium]|nr:NAD-dependent epimerase/dehydratase family protein [Candidatus Neomarinimicrobiota bacterium]
MADLKVLFIGGTGVISSACSRLAIQKGMNLYHLNRGKRQSLRPVQGVNTLIGDIRKPAQVKELINDHHFDVVVDWLVFEPQHIRTDIELFTDKTDQFIFISTASAYQTPPRSLPVTEDTPLENPFWKYSQKKSECENILKMAGKENGFPYTIVRPSHTYDKTMPPFEGGYTVLNRIKNEQKVVIHGDGSSIWTLTHHKDFAKGFVGLLGDDKAIGEAFHITSDHWQSWLQIYKIFANVLNVDLNPVFITSNIIAKYDKEMGDSLIGDKAHSMIFDNSKIKNLVPEFSANIELKEGAKEIVTWYENNPDQQNVDVDLNTKFDKMISEYSSKILEMEI